MAHIPEAPHFIRDFTVRVRANKSGKDTLLLDFTVQAESVRGAVLVFWSAGIGSMMHQQPPHLYLHAGYIDQVSIVTVFDNEPDEAPHYAGKVLPS